MSDREPLGYLACKRCGEVKKVFQGQGKRANYLYSNGCACGIDQRTGAKVQADFAKCKSLEEAQADAEAMKAATPPPTKDTEDESQKCDKAPWLIGAALGALGIFAVIRKWA